MGAAQSSQNGQQEQVISAPEPSTSVQVCPQIIRGVSDWLDDLHFSFLHL